MTLGALEGFVIGVTADRRSSEQAELLERRGASVLLAPTISTQYLDSDDALRHATEAVIDRAPDYLVATTGIGVRAWFDAAQAWGLGEQLSTALAVTRVIPRGPKAAAAAQIAGLHVLSTPEGERLDNVVSFIARHVRPGQVVAFQHYGEHNTRAVAAVQATGAEVIEVPVYRYGQAAEHAPVDALLDALQLEQVDAVTFTSAPALQNLLAAAERRERRRDVLAAFNERGVVAACIGPVCAEVAQASGIEAPAAPPTGRLGLLVRTLTDALLPRRRELACAGVPVVVQGRAMAVAGGRVELAPRERAVFDILAAHNGAVVSKTAILDALGSEPASTRALEVAVTRLRRRLGPAGPSLQAVRRRGYRLHLTADSAAALASADQ